MAGHVNERRLKRDETFNYIKYAGNRTASAGRDEFIRYEGIIRLLKYFDNLDRKSTRLNSSHVAISYAVFCLKKKTNASMTSLEHLALPIRCHSSPGRAHTQR